MFWRVVTRGASRTRPLRRRWLSTPSNPLLAELEDDYLYHLGLGTATHDLAELFSDVKYFCCGGSANRMHAFAEKVADELGGTSAATVPFGLRPAPIGKTDRFSMFKVGPVLMSSHGMGQPSFSILLHEVTKMLSYAGAKDVTYFRLGTSGGLGVPPGTVVVTTKGVDGTLDPTYRLPICGKIVERPSEVQASLVDEIIASVEQGGPALRAINVTPGRTMAADCFYEGQSRLDGAICEHTEADKMAFLQGAYESGVRNIEMEALQFCAFTQHLSIPDAVCCVTLINRLDGDQVLAAPEQMEAWDAFPGDVVLQFIKSREGL